MVLSEPFNCIIFFKGHCIVPLNLFYIQLLVVCFLWGLGMLCDSSCSWRLKVLFQPRQWHTLPAPQPVAEQWLPSASLFLAFFAICCHSWQQWSPGQSPVPQPEGSDIHLAFQQHRLKVVCLSMLFLPPFLLVIHVFCSYKNILACWELEWELGKTWTLKVFEILKNQHGFHCSDGKIFLSFHLKKMSDFLFTEDIEELTLLLTNMALI